MVLAGIYDSRGHDRARAAARLSNAFGPEVEAGAYWAGPLVVVHSAPAQGTWEPGGAGCVLEGSIYNAAELAHELGVDPAVAPCRLAAAAYARWGETMPARLRGRFALVAWNGEEILVAGDQKGIGAVFVRRSGEEIAFAGEVRDLLGLLVRTPAPDEVALVHWLTWQSFRRRTMYEGVTRLGAGGRLSIRRGEVSEARYWTPAYEPCTDSRLECAAALRQSITRAVQRCAGGLEEIGVQLSGGLDSSMVAAVTARTLGDPGALRSYSCVFAGDRWMDDSRFIDALLADVPMRDTRYRPHPTGLLAVILEYLRDWRMPTHGLGWLMNLPVMRGAAGDGIGALLDGHGGDSLFGPAEFLLADLIRGGQLLAAAELARNRWPGASAETPWSTTARTVAPYALGALPIRVATALDRRTAVPPYVSPRAARVLSDSRDTYDWATGESAPRWWLGLRHRLTVLDDWPSDYFRHHSAKWGVEVRSPLHDVELAETVLRIPAEHGFGPRLDRPLAREAVAGLIPEALRLRRRKTLYTYFYRECVTGPDLPAIQRLLGGDRLEITPWVRPDYLRERLSKPPGPLTPGRLDWVRDVTGCLAVECWLRSLSDPSFASDLLADPALSRPGWVAL